MSNSSRKFRSLDFDNPSYYRLSQDLRNYRFPPYLNIQELRISPDCDVQYSSADLSVEILVKIEGQEHCVHIFTPNALCPGLSPQVMPSNCVVVPRIDGASVAHAIELIVQQGIDTPRQADRLLAMLTQELGVDGEDLFHDSEERPSKKELQGTLNRLGCREPGRLAGELLLLWPRRRRLPEEWELLRLKIQDVLTSWGLCTDRMKARRLISSVAGCMLHKRYIKPIDIVERLLFQELGLSEEEYHQLAEQLFDEYRELSPAIFAYRG